MNNIINGNLGYKAENAYELAVENGYDGTLNEWLDSLDLAIADSIDSSSTNSTASGTKAVYDYVEGHNFAVDSNYIHTDNNFTSDYKTKVDNIGNLSDLDTSDKTSVVGAINEINSNVVDTGWKNLTLSSGLTGTAKYRAIGNHVYVRLSLTYSVLTENQIVATGIPSEYRPLTGQTNIGFTGGKRISRIAVTTDGELECAWCLNISDGSDYTTANWHEWAVDYLLD